MADINNITCPSCKYEFPLGDAVLRTIREDAVSHSKNLYNEQIRSLTEERDKANENERQLLEKTAQKEQALEDKEKSLNLQIARKVKAGHDEIRERIAAEHKLEMGELENRNATLTEKLEQALKNAEKGLPAHQGNVSEDILREKLSTLFPNDEIAPIPKGPGREATFCRRRCIATGQLSVKFFGSPKTPIIGTANGFRS